ncbi:MAG: uroporphyrinogen-III C-methyltransferase [Rhodospirillales bacterium]|nr:uroporphyrinogen-III C-methyltransferase [Rhodospirillales bacterium]MBO6786360.1 uroporphyrinogen-III C-methyltransferase [Rhodospirillales bacterium]
MNEDEINIHPVMLVGAGPGDPDLLTVKAHRLIGDVDVIVYDRLVAKPILELIPDTTERIFAGKRASNHYMPQEDINNLLVDLARVGKKVMRLKGGDPFVFGRGGEEALHLVRHGIPFEVVPGITSSAGCAAYAGIPLTHRGLAQGVRFVTGHSKSDEPLTLDWRSLADPETTLVVYMGMANVEEISTKLIENGLTSDTPVAVINMGTRPAQKTLLTTLSELPGTIKSSEIKGATLFVIGRVVTLAEELAWFETAATH